MSDMKKQEQLGPETNAQSFSAKEFELIQKLIQARMESSQELEYENLEGYEVPPRTQFSMLKKPAVTIKEGKLSFNMACIRLFEGVKYIVPVIHEEKHRLAVIPCAEEESASIDWARKNKEDNWVNKEISNKDLIAKVGQFMNWDTNCRYKVLGEIKMSARGLILVFDLDEAIMFETYHEEFVDEETGEIKKKRRETKYYPDKYKGKIGMSYSDYAESRQMNLFEDFTNYFSPDGTPVENASGTENEEAVQNKNTLIQSNIQIQSRAKIPVPGTETGEQENVMSMQVPGNIPTQTLTMSNLMQAEHSDLKECPNEGNPAGEVMSFGR